MKLIKILMAGFILLNVQAVNAQTETETDTSTMKGVTLKEVVISVNLVEETKKTIAQQTQVLRAEDIAEMQAQTTADVLANSGNVFVQKSQMGAGSPVIRGFEANRILLVVDGVRMNNLIYRSGHLQDIVKTDNNIMDRVEVLFGPSSNVYGSDALGGVIHMYTRKPQFATEEKMKLKVNAMSRYGTAANEVTGHVDFNVGLKKLASLTSFTYSKFDDLKGGENQNPFYTSSYGERPYYVERIGNVDYVIKNKNRYIQVGSGYSQYDIVQKFAYMQNTKITHGLNLQYSTSSDIPRYDRLTLDPSRTSSNTGSYRFAEWYYGPQMRMLAAYDFKLLNESGGIHFGLSYQAVEESRHDRRFSGDQKDWLNHRAEDVNVIGINLDFRKIIGKHNMRFGADAQLNNLTSTATTENILDGASKKLDTRYPDGDNTMNNVAAYWSHTWLATDQITLTDGFRVGYSTLHSTLVDTAVQFHLPYTDIQQSTPVYSGSIGIINTPSETTKISFLVSAGFRVPNVDDVAKIFEIEEGTVRVPNPDLKPERTVTYEAGITNVYNAKTKWENVVYYTDLFNAVAVDEFTFNGQDSILFNGDMAKVYANQNQGRAYVYGYSSNLISQCTDHLQFALSVNYTYGRIKTDSSDVPLDHIPPFFSRMSLKYQMGKFSSDFFVNFNGWKRLKDYYPNIAGEDNQPYATPDGMPAWFTANVHLSYKVHKLVTLQFGIDNVFDTQYRAFASGINAPGRNIFGAIRFHY
jgi:hemoglobin/transferrin/lactoferrin receptor protein